MRTAILARHGESDMNAQDELNSDADVAVGLSVSGEEQARRLGEELAREPIDLCVTSGLTRTRRTAELALAGRDVPTEAWPELNDPLFGAFEGGPFQAYREWAWAHGSTDEPPGGGESRQVVVARYARALRRLLGREEVTVLVVIHSLPIAYVLGAVGGADPAQRMAPIDYARPFRLEAEALEHAVARLEAWCAAPSW
ncbi:MAG TPA: histidine phosphatase family protein [Gaiellaceae bacterium]|nr:histidine phosphatase family protein [Gaiellaceae bacterium]